MANELLIHSTIGDIISAFSHDVEEKTGRPLSEFKWPNALIYWHLINQRAEIIYATRKQNQLEGNYEDYNEVIPCVEMKETDMVECPCAPSSGCTFMKSVLPMPKILGGIPKATITTLDGFERYNYVEWSMFKHRINNRIQALNKSWLFTKKTIGSEEWLYTYITRDIKARNVTFAGVPIDPMEFYLFPICGKVSPNMCDPLDLNFIIEKRLINALYDATFRKLINYNNGTQVGDTKGDDRNAPNAADPRY